MENVKNDFYKKGQFPKPAIYREQLLTVDDLNDFKRQLLFEIKNLLKEYAGQPTKKCLKSKDVMKLLHISPGTLQTFRDNGTVPFKKVGGIIIYDSLSIQKILES
jgi:hypothetical protein